MVATIREATQLLLDRFGGKKFQSIFIKPPWNYRHSPLLPRPVGQQRARPLALSLPHLRSLPLYPLGQPASRLFLYAPTGFLPEALALLREWGFPYEGAVAWQAHWDKEFLAENVPAHPKHGNLDEPDKIMTKLADETIVSADDADNTEVTEETEESEESEETDSSAAAQTDDLLAGAFDPAQYHPATALGLGRSLVHNNGKNAPPAFLLIGKRARKFGMDTPESPILDKSSLRIRRLKHHGVPRMQSVQQLIEFCCPPSYLELFARSNRKGWSYWGFEAELIYPGWLDDAVAQDNDVMFDLPDLVPQRLGIDHLGAVIASEAILAEESNDEESNGEDSNDEEVLPLALDDVTLDGDDNITEEDQSLGAPADPARDKSESAPADEAEAIDMRPDESLEDAYETAFEQVSTDETDRPRPPIDETIPLDDIAPRDKLLNQDEEEEAESVSESPDRTERK